MRKRFGAANEASLETVTVTTKHPPDDSSAYLRRPKPLRADGRPTLGQVARSWVFAGFGFISGGAAAWFLLFGLVLQSEPFRLDPDLERLEIRGMSVIEEEEVAGLFVEDAGCSLVSLDPQARLDALRALPWVRGARVARLWPDSVTVTIEERRPVAFLRVPGSTAVRMVDPDGVILDLRGAAVRSLPVLSGVTGDMPLADRRKRVELFEEVMEVFRARGPQGEQAVSEVDVSDARNAVVLAKHGDRMIKLQMGHEHLAHRLDVFLNYIEAWKSEFGPLGAVDLRFEKQVAIQPVVAGKERR